jgi:hypothetical protein
LQFEARGAVEQRLAHPGQKENNDPGACVMPTARYFRNQASLCLELARHMSDATKGENFRARAAAHSSRATELERVEAEEHPNREAPSARQLNSLG